MDERHRQTFAGGNVAPKLSSRLVKIAHRWPAESPSCSLSYRERHLTTFASRTCVGGIGTITLRPCACNGVATVSCKPRQVSTAIVSDVNPRIVPQLERELARTLVPAQIRQPHTLLEWRRSAYSHASSLFGDGAAGMPHPRGRRPAPSGAVAIRHRSGNRRLARLARRRAARRYLDQSAALVSARPGLPGIPLSAAAQLSGFQRHCCRGQRQRDYTRASRSLRISPGKCDSARSPSPSTISGWNGRPSSD